MSYEEIAAVALCQLGTVRSRLHYARQTLKELLG
jgi:DNA-directed RNA polymerase specialized sigma24 family protein